MSPVDPHPYRNGATMPSPATDPAALVRLTHEAKAAFLALDLLVASVQESGIQWRPSPIPKPREDTAERASGGYGDPVPRETFDARRLAVRDAMEAAARELETAVARTSAAKRHLEDAVDAWTGA